MLPFALRYWRQIAVGVLALAAGLWLASSYYQPKIDRLVVEAATLRASVAVQNEGIESVERAAEEARRRAREALDQQRRRAQKLDADNQRLREALAGRVYKDEPCDNAAAALRERWLSR